MGGDEEELKAKLMALDRDVSDPGLDARQRDLGENGYGARRTGKATDRIRMEKRRASGAQVAWIDEDTNKRAQKVCRSWRVFSNHANL